MDRDMNGAYAFYLRLNNGDLYIANNTFVYDGNVARPVLYLDPSVYVVDGSGTMSDPYIIGM